MVIIIALLKCSVASLTKTFLSGSSYRNMAISSSVAQQSCYVVWNRKWSLPADLLSVHKEGRVNQLKVKQTDSIEKKCPKMTPYPKSKSPLQFCQVEAKHFVLRIQIQLFSSLHSWRSFVTPCIQTAHHSSNFEKLNIFFFLICVLCKNKGEVLSICRAACSSFVGSCTFRILSRIGAEKN